VGIAAIHTCVGNCSDRRFGICIGHIATFPGEVIDTGIELAESEIRANDWTKLEDSY